MGRRTGLVSFCCVLLASSSSWAAAVDPVRPTASINQGQGFQIFFSRVQGNPGDSVMVGPGGLATITYDDGCKVEVNPGRVETIQNPSPCSSGAFAQTDDWGLWVAAGGAAAGAGFAACAATGCFSSNKNNTTPLSP